MHKKPHGKVRLTNKKICMAYYARKPHNNTWRNMHAQKCIEVDKLETNFIILLIRIAKTHKITWKKCTHKPLKTKCMAKDVTQITNNQSKHE